MAVLLAVPYFSQLDNRLNPAGSCNVTSMAMCLHYHGIRGDGSEKQLEDQIYNRFVKMGLSRHSCWDMQKVFETYPKIRDVLTTRGTPKDIITSIDRGQPVVIHGYFTRFGHIIVIRGYDQDGYVVNDPYGEAFYNRKTNVVAYDTRLSGEALHYSYEFINNVCSPESKSNPSHFMMHSVARTK